MELWQHLLLSLYCRFLIDLAENVKAGPSFLTCGWGEVWGAGRCFLSQNRRASFSTRLLSCWGLPWRLSKRVLGTKPCPSCCRTSSGLATLDTWAVHTQTCACTGTAASHCSQHPGAAGRDISKRLLCFHPDQARTRTYSMSWALLPPSGGCSALMRVQPSPMLAAGGQGQHGDVLKHVIFTFKGYHLHWSPELVCCWQMEPAVPVNHVPYLCVCGATLSRLCRSCFFCTREVLSPP